jgi:hypothetical protein
MENLWIAEIFVSMKKKNLWAVDLVWTVFAVYVRNDVIVLLLYAIQSIPSDIYLVLNMWYCFVANLSFWTDIRGLFHKAFLDNILNEFLIPSNDLERTDTVLLNYSPVLLYYFCYRDPMMY